jgi:hypothetical protein
MRRVGLGLVVASLVVSISVAPSLAQTAPAKTLCARLNDSIELNFKLIAQEDAERSGDNSAPRASLSAAKINNLLLISSMNLQLMRDNGCVSRKEPLSQSRYVLPALTCHMDILKQQLGQELTKMAGSPLPASCDLETWKPLGQEDDAKP